VDGARLTLEIASGFHREGLMKGDAKKMVEDVLSRLLGGPVFLVIKSGDVPPRPASSASPVPVPAPVPVANPDWVEKEPVVKAAMKIFRARIADVRKPTQTK